VCAHATEIVHVDDTQSIEKRLSSSRENMPLRGILRYLHQFVKSKLENGTSLNFVFVFILILTAEERERVYVHPLSTSGG